MEGIKRIFKEPKEEQWDWSWKEEGRKYHMTKDTNHGVGLAKFDTTREHDTNPTRFWWVWVEYNRVWVISMLTRLTRLINGSYSC